MTDRQPKQAWEYNPGSREAIALGCQCSASETHNGFGIGIRRKDWKHLFRVSANCEVHRDWDFCDD